MKSSILPDVPPSYFSDSPGNMGSAAPLENVIRTHLTMTIEAFEAHHYLESGRESLVIRE